MRASTRAHVRANKASTLLVFDYIIAFFWAKVNVFSFFSFGLRPVVATGEIETDVAFPFVLLFNIFHRVFNISTLLNFSTTECLTF